MDILEKALLEWSIRTDKGYPDISNEEDLHIFESIFGFKLNEQDVALGKDSKSDEVDYYKEILSLLDKRKDNKKLLVRVYRILSESPHIDEVKKYLNESGITKDTFDERNLPNEIISILLSDKRGSSVEQFYDEIVGESNNLLKSGNVYKTIKDPLLRTKIQSIGRIPGSKNSVTVGAGEILFPLLFSDLKQKSTSEKGDLTYQNSKNMEVKSTSRTKNSSGARLGSSRSSAYYIPKNNSIQGYGGQRYMQDIIYDDYKASEQNGTLKDFREYLVKFLYNAYKSNETIRDFNSPEDVYKLIVNSCILGYKQEKNIDIFLLFDPINGSYKTLLPNELVRAILEKEIKITNFTQSGTIPQLLRISTS